MEDDFALDPPSNHSSPHEYDQDHFDSNSSSSSSGDSPSSDSAYPSSATPSWAYDLGLSVPAHVEMTRDDWVSPLVDPIFGVKGEGAFGAEGMMGEDEGGLALTSDFWSTAPSTTLHSPVESKSYHRQHAEYYDEARTVKAEEADSVKEMEVDFEDLVNGDVCGPASAAPSFPSYQPTPQRALTPVYAPSPVSLPDNPHSGVSLFLSGMSMPVDLLAVNAGISPQLTGGLATPPLPNSAPQENAEAQEWMTAVLPEDLVGGTEEEEEQVGRTAVKSERASRESSQSREEEVKEGPPTNLVAKDAIVAAKVIEALVVPPKTTTGLQLLVLGVPVVGAKSRVETQIKISLVLVGQKAGKVKAEDEEQSVEDLMTSDGGLQEGAGDQLNRIGTWSHVRLPKFLALKKKNKKQVKPDPDEADTLFLDVAVIRGSEPHEEIFICTGCRQREHKRAQRKKEARVRPANEASEVSSPDEDEERRKVVIFNCSEYVEFGAGEVVLPTRITCYCRHHKERLGFSVTFSLRTSTGTVVASGSTPPIMITDDHKTSVRPSGANSVSHSADVSFDSLDVDCAPTSAPRGKRVKAVKKEKAPAVVPSAQPKRAARAKVVRGATESDEEFEEPLSARTTGKKHAAAAKPYDSDARPRKRQSGVHKSPSFAMTPLTMSKPPSPTLRPVPDAHINVPVQPSLDTGAGRTTRSESWGSALGLGGMDSVMADATTGRHGSNAFSVASAYSTAASTAPSPAQSYDWRSTASSPLISPGSTSTAADTFSSYFNALQSPDMASSIASTSHSALPSPQPQQLQSGDGSFGQLYNTASSFVSIPQTVPSMNWSFPHPRLTPPPPRISRLIPGEGPVHGGIEVTVLGENFVRDLVCVFGDSAAVPTHFWSSNTLVCILPPSANPGPVVVGIKGVPLSVEQGAGLQLFTYKDDSDRSLLELALQVVGLKMTGRLEDASAVAMRIVGNNGNHGGNAQASSSRQVSPTGPVDTAALAMRMSEASASVYASPASSRPPSRQASIVNLNHLSGSPSSTSASLPLFPVAGETRNFEGIVIKFLSLIDLDPSLIPGSAPSLPLALSPISHVNAQRHSLLHLATVLGFHRLVQFLLARGIDIESADRNGFTALHFAALYGRVAITRQLLEAGASRSAKNLAGKTPLDIARDRDDIDVEEIFFRSRPATASTARPQQQRFDLPPYTRTSAPGTPASDYARSVVSDYDASESESEEDDEEDSSSFDSSDEESLFEVERTRISRNPSMVSLHYLLEAEADVDAEFSPLRTTALPLPFVDEKKLDTISPPVDPQTAKLSPTAWLSRSFQKPAVVPFESSTTKVPQRSMSTGVWDKMPGLPNGAWEKMRLPNAFALPLQMPAVTAFPSMASMPAFSKSWMSGRSEGADSGGEASGSESEGKVVKEWPMRAWWPSKALDSPPPPVYSATDTLAQAPASPTPSTSSLSPMRASSSGLKRRSAVVMDEQMARSDRMLMLFWLPVLILVLAFAAYSSFDPYIRPVLAFVTESIFGSGTADGAPINPLAAAWLQQRDNL